MEGAMVMDIGLIADPLNWPLWPAAKAFLDPALARSDETWADVEEQLAECRAHLAVVMQKGGDPLLAAAVLRTIRAKHGDVTEVFLIGGKQHRRWTRPLSDALVSGARDAGCVGLRAWGRPGWKGILTACGWRSDVLCYERAV